MEKKRFVTNNISLQRENVTVDDKYIHIKGYACHFNEPNHNGEVVTASSFDTEMLRDMNDHGLMPSLNIHHTYDIVGVWDRLSADEKGIIAEGRLFRDARINNVPIETLVESGAISHLSTEGYTNGWYDDEENVRYAEKFYLISISLVALPADFGASVEISENKLLLERKKMRSATENQETEESKNNCSKEENKCGLAAYLFNL